MKNDQIKQTLQGNLSSEDCSNAANSRTIQRSLCLIAVGGSTESGC